MEQRPGSMAATVNIANTHHLTYSPLSDKHNVLYDRARQNFRHDYSQGTRFNINPILDKDSTKGQMGGKFRPEVEPRMQPPASLTIVENLTTDPPVLTKQFSIGAFWEFLFSNRWTRDHSVRVLQGPLQTLIIGSLVKLIQTGEVTNHSTKAFAKNIHKRRPIRKHPDKNAPDLGDRDETLYLEFTYYGRSAKQWISNTCAVDSGDYAYDDGTSSVGSGGYAYEDTSSECVASSEAVTSIEDMSVSGERNADDVDDAVISSIDCMSLFDGQSSSSSINVSAFTPVPPTEDSTIKSPNNTDVTGAFNRRQKTLRRRIKSAPADRNHEQRAVSRRQRCKRLQEEDDTRFEPSNDSSSSNGSDEDAVPAHDLRDFRCTERVQYLGEFDLSSDDSDSSTEECDETGFQQELYLGEKTPRQAWASTADKLRARKTELQHRRAEARRNTEQRTQAEPKKGILPEWSELDLYKYLTEDEIERITHVEVPDRMPTFEEYCQKMAFDEELKARSRGGPRRKFTESIIRLSLIKSGYDRFADQIIGLTELAPEHCFKRDPTFVALSEHMKHEYLEKINLAKGNFFKKLLEQSNDILVGSRMRLGIPDVFLTTPTGVTYLHPVCHKIARKYKRKEKKKRLKKLAGTIRMRKNIMRLWKHDSASSESEDDVETEKEVLSNSHFDTTKIKVSYSEEKLGKFDERNRLQAELALIMQRYRRVKSVLIKFGRGAMPFRSRMIGTKTPESTGAINDERKDQVRRNVNVVTLGKMKWFPFLNARSGPDSSDAKSESGRCSDRSTKSVHWRKTSCTSNKCAESTLNIASPNMCAEADEEGPFSNLPEHVLIEKLVRALEQFVVRRETVVSDQKSSASVSVTFTRKSVFTRPKSASVFTRPKSAPV